MKKNSRIVTMAAAALLAVAPVAAGVVPGATTVNTVQAAGNKKSATVSITDVPSLSVAATDKAQEAVTASMINNYSLGNLHFSRATGIKVVSKDGGEHNASQLKAGDTYYVQATVDVNGAANTTYSNSSIFKGGKVTTGATGTASNQEVEIPLTVYNPNASASPYFVLKDLGQSIPDGTVAPIASEVKVTKDETITQILAAAKSKVTFADGYDSKVNNNNIITTPSDVISELQKQGITVTGSGANAKVNATQGFNVTLTGQTPVNGSEVTIKIPFVPSGAVVTDGPVINVAIKPLGSSVFGTATEASKGNQYYQVASGSNFNPLDFTTSNGTEVKFSATQSSKDNSAATLTATSNPVNTSEAGKFYHVTLTATNNGKKTSTYSYIVLVVSNGLQELYADAKTYNIYGDNVQATGQTIAKGTKVYVGNDTKTINKVSYSKISTKDADAGNLWIETSALAKPAGDTNTETHTIMVNSKAYDKNGNYLGHMYYAYNNIDIVPNIVTIKGKTYYKVANKDEYVRVTNITGTQRKLRHNAYIYWSSPQVLARCTEVKL